MLKSETQEIDGFSFTTTQFPAMYAFGLLARLVKAIGPVMGSLGGLSMDTMLTDAGPALASGLASLNPDDAQKLVIELLKQTSVLPDGESGKRHAFTDSKKVDEFFSGRLKTMFQVLGFAIKVNFEDFAPGSALTAKDAPINPLLATK